MQLQPISRIVVLDQMVPLQLMTPAMFPQVDWETISISFIEITPLQCQRILYRHLELEVPWDLFLKERIMLLPDTQLLAV